MSLSFSGPKGWIEQRWIVLLTIPTAIAGAVALLAGGGVATFALAWISVPLGGIGIPLAWILHRSRRIQPSVSICRSRR